MSQTIKRLNPETDGPLGNMNLKRVRESIIDRIRMLAARRRWTLEYTTDRLLQVGLDAYESEDGKDG